MNNLLDSDLIFANEEATNSTEVLKKLGSAMIEKGFAKENYIEGLLEREKEFATGVPVEPVGVAIPHTDASYVNENKISIMTLKNPIQFCEMGGSAEDVLDVKLVFLLGLADSNDHLQALQTIIQILQDPSFVHDMIHANDKDSICKITENKLNHALEEEKK